MRLIRILICAMLLSSASAWCLEQDLGVYFAGSEVSFSELDIGGSAPLYEGGLSYALSMQYLRATTSAGIGGYRSNPSYTAGFSVGPKLAIVEHKLDLGLGLGLGYLGYYKNKETSAGLKEEFTSELPVQLSMNAAFFDRVDATQEFHWNSKSWWRFKLGLRLLKF